MRHIQFSLATLLIVPLVLSPLLIAIRECRQVARGHSGELVVATVLLGFIYVLVLTLIDCARRSPATNRPHLRSAIRGTIRGCLYSLLYYMLVFLPVAAAEQYYFYWSWPWRGRLSYFAESLSGKTLTSRPMAQPMGAAFCHFSDTLPRSIAADFQKKTAFPFTASVSTVDFLRMHSDTTLGEQQ